MHKILFPAVSVRDEHREVFATIDFMKERTPEGIRYNTFHGRNEHLKVFATKELTIYVSFKQSFLKFQPENGIT